MSDLRDLYQQVIIDHNKNPRNLRSMEDTCFCAQGHNPLCGDTVTIFLEVEDGVIRDASFSGSGCAISTASASMLTEAVKGKTVEDARKVFDRFQSMVTANPDAEAPGIDDPVLGKLAVFSGVCHYPMRVKCATLAWHTFNAAMVDPESTVTTE